MSSLNEPVALYRDNLRSAHAEAVSNFFEQLVSASGVDEETNRRTIAEIAELEASKSKSKGKKGWWVALRVFLLSASALPAMAALSGGGWNYLWLLATAALIGLSFWQVEPKIKGLKNEIYSLQESIDLQTAESWEQMEALNALHRWDAARSLMGQTFPQLKIEEHFSERGLQDLLVNYGLDASFKDGRSILRLKHGTLFGNPLVITRFLQHWIGMKSYQGSLVIYWTENVRNAQGQMQSVQRSQTLTATVTKQYPEFVEQAGVVLGHEAAPSLSFSRMPSELSGLGEGRFNDWRKASALKGVEKKAKKALKTGSGQLTVMSNREFETLFKATDRDHEIEFRLLFTPLAQQEIVTLLNDKSVGYGDGFTFIKRGRSNYVEPAHLVDLDLDPEPASFHSNDIDRARKFFNDFHNEYFRSLFFGIAPYLAVPLYTEPRSLPLVDYRDGDDEPNAWEVEVMANILGEDQLQHPDSITRNLLTAEIVKRTKNGVIASVVALGYEGIDRVDFVPVLGGDGSWHQVPVPWVEYIPVENDSRLLVARVKEEVDPTRPGAISAEDWPRVLEEMNADPDTSRVTANLGVALID